MEDTELKKKIVMLRENGKSYSQIRDELGCSKATISYYLGAGQRKKTSDRMRYLKNAARQYIQDVKTAAVCMDCGEDYPYWVLQFDHVRGTKDFNLSTFAGKTVNLEKIKEEIAKCDIVCGNCHADRTHARALGLAP